MVGQSNVVHDLGVQLPEPGELGGPDSDRVPLKQETNAPLAAEHRQDLADHLVHPGNRPQRLQSGAVGGVLPADMPAISGKVFRGRGAGSVVMAGSAVGDAGPYGSAG